MWEHKSNWVGQKSSNDKDTLEKSLSPNVCYRLSRAPSMSPLSLYIYASAQGNEMCYKQHRFFITSLHQSLLTHILYQILWPDSLFSSAAKDQKSLKRVIGVVYCLCSCGMIIGMDLQLGLAVSGVVDKGFDLNCSQIEIKGDIEAIPLGNRECSIKKRNFLEAFEEKKIDAPRTLPLLVWESQTNHGDDLEDEADSIAVVTNNTERNDDHCVVGWPPINSWRKRICQQNRQECIVNCVAVQNGGGSGAGLRGRNSMYVKVKMEGVGIARKVDVSLHHSHQSLLQTLVGMFGKSHQSVQLYQLNYQDEEGDWRLVEDENWGSFIRSVQRLKLVRK